MSGPDKVVQLRRADHQGRNDHAKRRTLAETLAEQSKPGEVLRPTAEGLGGVLERIDQLLKEQRPGIIVIDSFKALQPYAGDQGEFRRSCTSWPAG